MKKSLEKLIALTGNKNAALSTAMRRADGHRMAAEVAKAADAFMRAEVDARIKEAVRRTKSDGVL